MPLVRPARVIVAGLAAAMMCSQAIAAESHEEGSRFYSAEELHRLYVDLTPKPRTPEPGFSESFVPDDVVELPEYVVAPRQRLSFGGEAERAALRHRLAEYSPALAQRLEWDQRREAAFFSAPSPGSPVQTRGNAVPVAGLPSIPWELASWLDRTFK